MRVSGIKRLKDGTKGVLVMMDPKDPCVGAEVLKKSVKVYPYPQRKKEAEGYKLGDLIWSDPQRGLFFFRLQVQETTANTRYRQQKPRKYATNRS